MGSAHPNAQSPGQTFMGGAAGFLAQFFPIFLLGAVFGKVMDDSGSALAIARFISERLGRERTVLAVVLSFALLPYGGVSLFVLGFAVVPVADALFPPADIPHRLIPATVAPGGFTLSLSDSEKTR